MGLDMYAYVAARAGQQNEFYEGAEFDQNSKDFVNKTVTKPRELAYWRKHPNLHGWMEKLAEQKHLEYDNFNGIELELTAEDLDNLERTIKKRQLPSTSGFFFGDPSDEHYRKQDLEFIKNARAELFMGLKVFYNSSW
jgi:hypothetical protein